MCVWCRASEGASSLAGRKRSRAATVLDMGLYETPLCMLPPALTTQHEPGSFLQPSQGSIAEGAAQLQGQQGPVQQLHASGGRSVSFMSGASSLRFGLARLRSETTQSCVTDGSGNSIRAAAGCGHVRLYQLVTPQLAGRAVVFGSKLALCPNWRCLDPPYFSAPGAVASRATAQQGLSWLLCRQLQ